LETFTFELLGERVDTPAVEPEAVKEEPKAEVDEPWEEGWDEPSEEEVFPFDEETYHELKRGGGEIHQHGDATVKVQRSRGISSGITSETVLNAPLPPHARTVRTGGERKMVAPGNATVVKVPKKKIQDLTSADASREGFEAYGDDATQDHVGLTGAEGHFDALLQQAYETDLHDRGFAI
jgi:hypothetical protein